MFGIEIRTAFMVLMLLAQHCFGDPTTSQQNHTSHSTEQPINSVSLKSSTDSTSHGSKSMHQPSSVPSAANHLNQLVSDDVQFDDFTQIVDLSDILVIFNVKELAAMWPKVQHDVRTECQHDMIEYFRGLAKQKVWAQKSKIYLLSFLVLFFVFSRSIDYMYLCRCLIIDVVVVFFLLLISCQKYK